MENKNDYVLKAYAYDKFVRIYACNSTNLVSKMQKLHHTWPLVSAALGRSLTVAAMMSLMNKANEKLTIIIDGNGPIGQMVCDARSGVVRGSVKNPEVDLKFNSNGHLAVGMGVGKGEIKVIKDMQLKEAFTSVSEIQTGEIGDDFAYYFNTSEQTPSAVGVGVLVNPDNSIKAAGGYILQLMPGCPEDVISSLEEKLSKIMPVSEMIDRGYTPEMIVSELTDGVYESLERCKIEYKCNCSKERFSKALLTIGSKELKDIIDTDGKAELLCHFCMKKYEFNKDELTKIYLEAKDSESKR